ncbi:hypothetical protein CJF32_00000223 [Rutstroemia sp. NJR-2017a WRK4]|nr:hypothetical protein CJF32_00000223 [Rutstroemia sp. NJR-2017a WRK4]
MVVLGGAQAMIIELCVAACQGLFEQTSNMHRNATATVFSTTTALRFRVEIFFAIWFVWELGQRYAGARISSIYLNLTDIIQIVSGPTLVLERT